MQIEEKSDMVGDARRLLVLGCPVRKYPGTGRGYSKAINKNEIPPRRSINHAASLVVYKTSLKNVGETEARRGIPGIAIVPVRPGPGPGPTIYDFVRRFHGCVTRPRCFGQIWRTNSNHVVTVRRRNAVVWPAAAQGSRSLTFRSNIPAEGFPSDARASRCAVIILREKAAIIGQRPSLVHSTAYRSGIRADKIGKSRRRRRRRDETRAYRRQSDRTIWKREDRTCWTNVDLEQRKSVDVLTFYI